MLVPFAWVLGCLGAGAATSAVLFTIADVSFTHALIVAVVTSVITGLFLLASTWMNRKTLTKMEDLRLSFEAEAEKEVEERAEAAQERAEILETGERQREEIIEAQKPARRTRRRKRRRT